MEKADPMDLYHTLSYTEWKTGSELLEALSDTGMSTNYVNRSIFFHLYQWEELGLISSRLREETRRREYLRISTGEPEKLMNKLGELERKLIPT
tara:strand:- start:1017 stop:1298 length:282 start_codon:yes stop_codon:yes gene_type:complete